MSVQEAKDHLEYQVVRPDPKKGITHSSLNVRLHSSLYGFQYTSELIMVVALPKTLENRPDTGKSVQVSQCTPNAALEYYNNRRQARWSSLVAWKYWILMQYNNKKALIPVLALLPNDVKLGKTRFLNDSDPVGLCFDTAIDNDFGRHKKGKTVADHYFRYSAML